MHIIIPTILQNIARSMLAFVSAFHVGVHIFYMPNRSVNVLNIGALYCESIHRSKTMKEDVKYRHVCVQLMNVQIDVVIPMEYAVRLGINRRKPTKVELELASYGDNYSNYNHAKEDDDVDLRSIYIDDFHDVGNHSTARSLATAVRYTATNTTLGDSAGNKYSNDCDTNDTDDKDNSIDYGDIYSNMTVSSSIACGTYDSDTILTDRLSINPLHISNGHSDATLTAAAAAAAADDDTSNRDSMSLGALQQRMLAVSGKSKSGLLSQYQKNALKQKKVVKAYQIPDKMRGKRGSFIEAYANIDIFIQGLKTTAGTGSSVGTAADNITTT